VFEDPAKKKKKRRKKKDNPSNGKNNAIDENALAKRKSADVDDAALLIQGLARRRIARRRVVELTKQAFEKLYDDESGAFYYWNSVVGEAQWHKPRILGPYDDCAMAEPDLMKPSPRHQSLSSRTPRTVRIPGSEGEAALMIQGLARRRIARRRVVELTKQAFEKLYDDESGAFYYWNSVVGEAQWHKPRILGPYDDCAMEGEAGGGGGGGDDADHGGALELFS